MLRFGSWWLEGGPRDTAGTQSPIDVIPEASAVESGSCAVLDNVNTAPASTDRTAAVTYDVSAVVDSLRAMSNRAQANLDRAKEARSLTASANESVVAGRDELDEMLSAVSDVIAAAA